MSNVFKISLLVLLVFVQTVDIAFLDNDQEALASVHTDLGINMEPAAAGHDVHCGCDMFHHFMDVAPNTQDHIFNSDTILIASSDHNWSRQNGPPVPPPLA